MTVRTPDPVVAGAAPAAPVPLGPAVWFAVVSVAMAGIVPAILIALTPTDGSESPAWAAMLALAVVAGVRFAWLVSRGELRLYEIVFWLFTYVFLGLAPVSQLRTNSYPGTTPDVHTALNGQAALVVWVGVLAFIIGVAIAVLRRPTPEDRRRISLVVPHRLMVFNVVVLLGCAYYVAKIGPGGLVLSRAARAVVEDAAWSNPTVWAIVKAFVSLAPVIAFAATMRLRRQRRAVGAVPPVAWAWIMAGLALAIDNPISTPRYVTGTAALGLLVALGAASRPRRLRILAVSLVAGMVLVFPLLDMFRYTTSPGDTAPTTLAETLQTADFDAFDQINNTVLLVDTDGIRGGQQALTSVFFFVPRAVWSTKAEDTGVLIAHFRDYKVTNLSAPIWTELYIDGSWVLLVVGMLLLGYVLRRADDAAVANFRTFPAPGVLSGTLPFYLIIMLRGSLLQSMAGLTVLALCTWLTGRRVPASRFSEELTSR